MIDFIFQVDLSSVYVILRRDFATAHEKNGTLTAPLSAGFFYTAAEANEAARQHCLREAAKGLAFSRSSSEGATVHDEEDGLYRGESVTREPGRERFEVRVKRLRAKGNALGGVMRGGGTQGSRRSTASGRRPGTAGHLRMVQEEEMELDEDFGALGSSSALEKRGSRIGRLWHSIRGK